MLSRIIGGCLQGFTFLWAGSGLYAALSGAAVSNIALLGLILVVLWLAFAGVQLVKIADLADDRSGL